MKGMAMMLRGVFTRHVSVRSSWACMCSTTRSTFLSHSSARSTFASSPEKPVSSVVDNILFNTNEAREVNQKFTLCALVMNEPGVLSRLSGLLAGRGFNIDSLVVSATESPELSRMTVVLQGGSHTVEQARRQMEDLVSVWAVINYSSKQIIERDLLLAKVTTSGNPSGEDGLDGSAFARADSISRRSAISELASLFGAKVLDIGTHHMIVELAAKASRLDAFLELLRPFGIIESSRSGVMAMARTPVSGLAEKAAASKPIEATVSDEALPPS